MKTLKSFCIGISSVPAAAAWYLAKLGESRGKQDLLVRQAPQKLKALRDHALIESAVSSNRIEGIEIDRHRVGTVIFGKPPLRDRNEEKVRGYRDALEKIHEKSADLSISMKTKNDITKLSNKVLSVGMNECMIPGHTSISCFLSSNQHTRNLRTASARLKVREAPKRK
jgi:hypothetical protein